MAAMALKEWASVIGAMLDGEQVVMLRKGGIGEAAFAVPAERFLLLPTHVHQRPELLVPGARDARAKELAITEEPARVDLRAWCEVAAVHEVTEQRELDALAPFHVLGPDYATARLKWRPRHPLVAIVARVHRVEPPVPLDVDADMRGCRSWIEVPVPLPHADPVIPDADFDSRANAVAAALAAARPESAAQTRALG
jgi:hypothetical protein